MYPLYKLWYTVSKGKGEEKEVLDIEELRRINVPERIAITEHARIRLAERGITVKDVINCIANGEIIEQYENDKPFPSCLVLGMALNDKYIHVVVSSDGEFIHLITAYYPSIKDFENDLKTRKGR
ncbi:MAG: DUF4258 domain-containing protein [Firmicutes bacterium]|nr:DUF4258 domain-containing protein [Bacillota bacterium]